VTAENEVEERLEERLWRSDRVIATERESNNNM